MTQQFKKNYPQSVSCVLFFLINRYLKGCPSCRQQWLPSRPAYEVVTSFLQSLVPSPEPRYAMFGPGMEELDVSFVARLLHYPDVLPISGISHRQINGEDVCEASLFLSHALKTQMTCCVSFIRGNTDFNKLNCNELSPKIILSILNIGIDATILI